MEMTSPTVSDPPVRLLGRDFSYKNLVAVVYVAALFIDIIDVTIVNVALPSIGRSLQSSDVEWVVLAYTLSLAVWIPASGWLGDRIGTKRVFCAALAFFVTASALCGLSQTVEQLIAFRVLQGVGGGMLTPVGLAMLYRAFPPAERAKAATVLIIPTVTAPALGPIIGGLLVTHADWRWIFLINLPIGVVTLWVALRYLRDHREPTAGRFDLPGFLLSGSGLALVVYAMSEGPRAGWGSLEVLGTGGIGVAALAAMVWFELRAPTPMLDLRLLRERLFRATIAASFFMQASFLGLIFLMPLYLQVLRGYSALDSGLATFPQALGVMAASQVSGRLYPRIGPRRLMTAGMFLSACVVLMFLATDEHTGLWTIRGLMLLRGMTMGVAFVPMQAASYARINPADNGRASSIFSTGRQISVSFGVALIATVLSSYTPLVGPVTDVSRAVDGFHAGYLVTAGLGFVAALVSFFAVRDADAANTMRPRRVTDRRRAGWCQPHSRNSVGTDAGVPDAWSNLDRAGAGSALTMGGIHDERVHNERGWRPPRCVALALGAAACGDDDDGAAASDDGHGRDDDCGSSAMAPPIRPRRPGRITPRSVLWPRRCSTKIRFPRRTNSRRTRRSRPRRSLTPWPWASRCRYRQLSRRDVHRRAQYGLDFRLFPRQLDFANRPDRRLCLSTAESDESQGHETGDSDLAR